MIFTKCLTFFIFVSGLLSLVSLGAKEEYSFTQEPVLEKMGKDQYKISFEVKEYCDVTIYVQDHSGKTIRHIGSGVLGKKPPAPFQANTKKQTILWDAKDDNANLVDNFNELSIVVCLGLKAQFERTLYWSPYKRTRSPRYTKKAPLITVSEKGVFLLDGESSENVRLYDHDAKYIRTIFPLPTKMVTKDSGLKLHTFVQDHKSLPEKGGLNFNQLLTTNYRDQSVPWDFSSTASPSGIAVKGDQVILVQKGINIVDEKNGKFIIPKSSVWQELTLGRMHEYAGGKEELSPTSVAVSTDGKTLYMAGYVYQKSWLCGGLNGVLKFDLEKMSEPQVFVGEMVNASEKKGPQSFEVASCVAVDQSDHVYIGDYGNNRIQVLKPDGTLVKNIAIDNPATVSINPKNGEIFVFSWVFPYKNMNTDIATRVKPKLTVLKSLEDPTVVNEFELPILVPILDGLAARAVVDFWAKEPRIWLFNPGNNKSWLPGKDSDTNFKIYKIENGKLVLMMDLSKETMDYSKEVRGARHMKQRLYFDYKNENLLVGEIFDPSPVHCTSMANITKINATTGEERLEPLPIDAEDMAIDMNGMAYLRTKDRIARFDALNWQEVPFDYGSEMSKLSTFAIHSKDILSGLYFESDFESSSQLGGMAISPQGNVVVTIFNESPEKKRGLAMYPGRSGEWQIRIWNKYGEVLSEDAIKGVGRLVGVNMDKDNFLYFMVAGKGKVKGELYYHPISCTYVKAKEGSRFLNSKSHLPLEKDAFPKRDPDIFDSDYAGDIWAEGADWIHAGVGFDGKRNKCHCASQSRPAFDYYARSFLPEVDRYSVLVLDSNGNEMLRFGRYGNVDDGIPLIPAGGPPNPHSIGGDEVAIMHNQMLATQSNKRVYLSDLGNARILSVLLQYHETKVLKVKE